VTTAADCQNCGAALAGRYCSACGQKADVAIPSFGRVLADAFGDLYSLDSRLWRSLGLLVSKPGRLTRSYLEGHRARYTPPFRMYIAASLVFFLVFSLTRPDPQIERLAADQTPPATAAPETPPTPPADDDFDVGAQPGGIHIVLEGEQWSCNLIGENAPLHLRQRLSAACAEIEGDGTSFVRAFFDNVPVMMLILIPIVAGIMRLLYLFAGRKYVEHLLFFAHVHTFFFVVGVMTMLLAGSVSFAPFLEWPVRIVSYAAWLYFPVYLFLAMRHVYAQSYRLTALKYAVLGGTYISAFVVTLLATVVVTALTL
jgi:hypothetical protein